MKRIDITEMKRKCSLRRYLNAFIVWAFVWKPDLFMLKWEIKKNLTKIPRDAYIFENNMIKWFRSFVGQPLNFELIFRITVK